MASLDEIFTKTLPEDVVRYEIYLLRHHDDDESGLQKALEDLRIKCLALAASVTCDYIWNNEGFNLCKAKCSDGGGPCLLGMTNFGDFIEDEWLIVWLLFQISSAHEDVVCRVKDNDGEFLLIEAADFLPKWLNPDTAKNRVFIHKGAIHIIPKPQNPGEIVDFPTGVPSVPEAMRAIRFKPGSTQAHVNIKSAIMKRIASFPEKTMEYVQKVNVYVPQLLAEVLDREPNLVSAAVRAFYYRDPIDLRACRVFKEFRPDTRIWCQVPMNRCSYAQLMQQVFQPDKRSGYTIPKNSGCDFKGMDLGSKLAHGFEILCASCSENRSSDERDLFDDIAFAKFLSALHKRDYFHSEIEGSKRYVELLENAKVYFTRCADQDAGNNSSIRESTGGRIKTLMNSIAADARPLERLIIGNQRVNLPEETSDTWMYLDDNKMDKILSGMKNGFEKLAHKTFDGTESKDAELHDLGEKMQRFVAKLSDYEGVEVPSESDPVSFDMDGFSAALSDILGPTPPSAMRTDSDSLSDDFLPSETDSETDDEVDGIRSVMEQMDRELSLTNVGKSFTRVDNGNHNRVEDVTGAESDSENENEQYKPVNLDLNLVQSFLESCSSELDLPGPATNLMQSVGLNVGSSDT